MSSKQPVSGAVLTIYLSAPLHAWIEEQAKARGVTLNVWVRDALASIAPPEVARAADRAARGAGKPAIERPAKPDVPPPAKPNGTPSFEALVEESRDRVLELHSRGYLENAIAAITHLPFKVVQHVLTTKAPPKKRPK